jgi:hypothetical protein
MMDFQPPPPPPLSGIARIREPPGHPPCLAKAHTTLYMSRVKLKMPISQWEGD